jgi:hypothetical protein
MAEDLAQEPFDATDPAANANAEREAIRKKRDDADQLRHIMRNKKGRAFLYRLLERCHIYGDTFAGEDTHISAFRQGEENVGKQLMLEGMDASPDLYVEMIKEQRDEEKRLDEVRRTEQRNREEAEKPPQTKMMVDLPPPAGYPGGPPLPKRKESNKG